MLKSDEQWIHWLTWKKCYQWQKFKLQNIFLKELISVGVMNFFFWFAINNLSISRQPSLIELSVNS